MQVCLARQCGHSKSIRSEVGIIKIAISCPFWDIMLSIKYSMHWPADGSGLLTLTSAVTTLA